MDANHSPANWNTNQANRSGSQANQSANQANKYWSANHANQSTRG